MPGAASASEKAVALLPDDAELQLAGGKRLAEAGEHEKAVPVLERAASLLSERAEVHAALGGSLLALKRFEPAARALGRATKLTPEQPKYHAALGRAELGLGNLQSAAESLEQAVRLNGSDTDGLLLIAEACKHLDRAPDAERRRCGGPSRCAPTTRRCTSSSART